MNMQVLKSKITEGSFNGVSVDKTIRLELERNDKLSLLLDIIDKQLKDKNVILKFELIHEFTNFKGLADYNTRTITITVKENLKDNYVVPIFAHELGEADYILNLLPVLDNTVDEIPDSLYRVVEVFSHLPIQNLFLKNKLELFHE